MERYCLTGQSPQRAVAPTEEEEELRRCTLQRAFGTGPVYYLPFLLSVYLLSKFCMAFLKALFHLLIRNKQLLFSTDVTIFDLDNISMVPYLRANVEQKT